MNLKTSLLHLYFFLTLFIHAQPGKIDEDFNTYGIEIPGLNGANSSVLSADNQLDSKIVIGGNFTSYNGIPVKYIARLHKDGSLDTNFAKGLDIDNSVESIKIISNGKIMIAGKFKKINNKNRNNIARLNSDGTLDQDYESNYIESIDKNFVIEFNLKGEAIISLKNIIKHPNLNDFQQLLPHLIDENGKVDTLFKMKFYHRSFANEINQTDVIQVGFNHENNILISHFPLQLGGGSPQLSLYHRDGTIDSIFMSYDKYGFGHNAEKFIVDSLGKIYYGSHRLSEGFPNSYGEIKRLNPNGEVDITYKGIDCIVCNIYNLALDKKKNELYYNGDGYTINRFSYRLDSLGNTDNNYYNLIDITNTPKFLVLPNEKLLCYGDFKYMGRNNILRLNTGEISNSLKQIDSNEEEPLIYPNPANDKIQINLGHLSALVNIKIYDTKGILVDHQNFSETQNITLNIQHLKSGLYFIQVTDTNQAQKNIRVLKI